MPTVCKHPRVRIVSRHDDSEFVECLECGEVFDSEEFNDMAIEETVGEKEEDLQIDELTSLKVNLSVRCRGLAWTCAIGCVHSLILSLSGQGLFAVIHVRHRWP